MSGYDVDGNRNHDNSFFSFHNPSSDRSYWNKRILVMAIASLTIVIIVVLALHIYARFVLRRQARRRFAIHQLSLTIQAQAHHHEHHHNRGLDPSIIATLPILKKKEQEDDDDYGGGECAVCLSVVEDEQEVRLLPNCKHSFHVGCIDTWLTWNSTCPICRTKAEPIIRIQLEPHPREPPAIPALDDASILLEGTSNAAIEESSSKNISGSSSVSRFSSSFRRMLSRDRSSSRIQPSIITHLDHHDLESQQ
ncbi:hypothetical protein PIB30_034102 [Stylosanthes scabra]|uniref:RING-type E3 ubiquitin transferase n=1 Tax=Stylosanthes scabra TaxID=79078 RepID=A0ABU6RCV6_9FABA|nr:hypothetical protein [Stylosanthes scabra]